MGTSGGPENVQGILRFLRDHPPTHYSFAVNSFSMMVKMKQEKYESDVFEAGGYKWKMIFYPNVNKEETNVKEHISLYLAIQDTVSLPEAWEVNVDFKLFVYNQTQKKFLGVQDVGDPIKQFHDGKREWGFPNLLEHEAFKDPTNGYLVKDRCIFGAEVFIGQPTKSSVYLSPMGDRQDYGSISKMDKQYALGGRDMRHGVPLNGYNLQNGLFRTFRDLGPSHFSFATKSLSQLCKNDSDVYESDVFESGGFKWRLCLYPKGNQRRNIRKSISLYLRIVETNDLSKNWEVFATFTFFVYDHIKDRFLTVQDGAVKRFRELKEEWGLDNLISLEDFEDASNGFLVNDECSFGTELFVIKQAGKTVEKLPVPVVTDPGSIFIWKLENISNLAGQIIYSEPFIMGGFKWKLRVDPTGNGDGKNNSMSIFLCLEEADKLSKSLELRLEWKIRTRDQLKNSHVERKYTYTFTSQLASLGNAQFISLEKLNDESLGYKKDDAVIIELPRSHFYIVAVTVVKEAEPIFIWKIENISKLAGKDIYSEPFSMGGFKWKLRVDPTGNQTGENNSMSIFLYLQEGDKLSKSLELRMERTFRIRNQLNNSHREIKDNDTYTSQQFNRGYSKFISLETLNDESLGYKKDDAVLIEFLCTSFSIHEVTTQK